MTPSRPSDAELIKLCDLDPTGMFQPQVAAIQERLKSLLTSEPPAQPTREEIARLQSEFSGWDFDKLHFNDDGPGGRERYLKRADAILALLSRSPVQDAAQPTPAQGALTEEDRTFIEGHMIALLVQAFGDEGMDGRRIQRLSLLAVKAIRPALDRLTSSQPKEPQSPTTGSAEHD